jgi:uncharacterized protein
MKWLNSFKATIQQSKLLAQLAFKQEHPKYIQKQVNKSIWHTVFNYRIAQKWYDSIGQQPLEMVTVYRPRLYIKPFRVYMSSKWTIQRRMKTIMDTYLFLHNNKLQRFYTNQYNVLASFDLKDNTKGYVVVSYDEKFRKEGELVLEFHHQLLGRKITAASFSFEQLDSNWVCRIGCVQGEKNIDDKAIKNLQTGMHGLRPKVLVIFAIQQLCNAVNIAQIFGASNAIQAFNKQHAIHLPWLHKIGFNYNKFWEEEGGKLHQEGWYQLPIIPSRKPIEDVKSHKRAYYKRRYELEESIRQQILVL